MRMRVFGLSSLARLVGSARRRLVMLVVLVLAAGGAVTGLAVSAQGAAFAAKASVQPAVQYLNDSSGTVFSFRVHNTGTSASIGAVQIDRPSDQWTFTGCPLAPAGWSTVLDAAS